MSDRNSSSSSSRANRPYAFEDPNDDHHQRKHRKKHRSQHSSDKSYDAYPKEAPGYTRQILTDTNICQEPHDLSEDDELLTSKKKQAYTASAKDKRGYAGTRSTESMMVESKEDGRVRAAEKDGDSESRSESAGFSSKTGVEKEKSFSRASTLVEEVVSEGSDSPEEGEDFKRRDRDNTDEKHSHKSRHRHHREGEYRSRREHGEDEEEHRRNGRDGRKEERERASSRKASDLPSKLKRAATSLPDDNFRAPARSYTDNPKGSTLNGAAKSAGSKVRSAMTGQQEKRASERSTDGQVDPRLKSTSKSERVPDKERRNDSDRGSNRQSAQARARERPEIMDKWDDNPTPPQRSATDSTAQQEKRRASDRHGPRRRETVIVDPPEDGSQRHYSESYPKEPPSYQEQYGQDSVPAVPQAAEYEQLKAKHCKTLGLDAVSVTVQEATKARRVLVLTCHPDKNPGDEEATTKTKELNVACDWLTDNLDGPQGQSTI